ncbi:serine/threonine-protein kinase [Streptomyces sp. NPDC093589]|uniref:serine/threonine-protein kinase n=1 Tax=Streptomyces sp. NPDC093589 TaxID=3366043 RepID=UPI00381FE0B9
MNRANGDDDRDESRGDDQDDRFGGIAPLAAGDPQRIGPYLLLGRLGAGGMGRVYLARNEGGRTVAVKVVHEEHTSDAQFRARFRREVSAARRVGKRYTAPVLDADPDAERPWVATGYVPGPSLEQVVRRYGPLPADSVHALAVGLLEALKDIHAAGIVHRDLKPSNVMLTVEGPRVIDFGVARALDTMESLLTTAGMVIGSPGFMSPEQVRGQSAEPKSDVFTLGCVLMYAVTGLLPFGQNASNQHAVMYQIVEDDPDLDQVPDERLRALIGRCLTKRVSQRPDVETLLAELEEAEGQTRRPAERGAWLPAALVADLAQQAARLLDADAPIPREAEAADPRTSRALDRPTAALRQKEPGGEPGAGAAPGAVKPEGGPPGEGAAEAAAADTGKPEGAAGRAAEPERRTRKRTWRLAMPVVAVVVVGGGSVLMLQPFSGRQGSPPADSSTATPGPGDSAGAPSPSTPKGAKGPKGSDGKGDKAKDGAKGKDGAGASGPASGGDGGGTASGGGPAHADASGGSTGGGSSSDGGGSGGSSGGASGGSTSGGGKVPSYFVGTWALTSQYAQQPNKVIISRVGPGEHAVRLITEESPGTSHCEHVAKLVSVADGGKRINLGSAPADQSRSGQFCGTLDPSSFTVSDPSGLQHDVGPSHGDGYHYERAN